MKHLDKKILEGTEIKWVKGGESVPMMQGIALNSLIKEYPGKGKVGWMFYSPEHWIEDPELPEACYYLLERNVEECGMCLVVFKENGDCVEGYAIIK